jgi:hypothetical protein
MQHSRKSSHIDTIFFMGALALEYRVQDLFEQARPMGDPLGLGDQVLPQFDEGMGQAARSAMLKERSNLRKVQEGGIADIINKWEG